MTTRNFVLSGLFVIALAGGLIWPAIHYHCKFREEETKRQTAELSLSLANVTIADMQDRQREVADLDAKYTKELADAKSENDDLQRKLDNGGRMLVKGKCPVPAAAQTTRSASLGDDATLELSSVAGRNILGIRAGIIQDQSALAVLQEYINTQCRK